MLNLENLPGVISEVNDYNLNNAKSTMSGTASVLILGTAIDGPKYAPVKIDSITDAISVFGDFKDQLTGEVNNATLIRGAMEAYKGGCRDIRLMRITGKTALASLKVANTLTLVAEAKNPGEIYNNVVVHFDHTNKTLFITKPTQKLTSYEKSINATAIDNVTIEYKYADYTTAPNGKTAEYASLLDFISKINKHPYNNVVNFRLYDPKGNEVVNVINNEYATIQIVSVENKVVKLSGGDNEINIDPLDLYMRLGGYVNRYVLSENGVVSDVINTASIEEYSTAVYDILANYKTDIIVLMDGNADIDLRQFVNDSGEEIQVTQEMFPKASVILNSALKIEAKNPGNAGNNIVISIKSPGTPGVVQNTVDGITTIEVTPATGDNKASSIATLINTDADSKNLVVASVLIGKDNELIGTSSGVQLTGGSNVMYSTTDNFARQLAQACRNISSRTHEVIGIIGCAPAAKVDLIGVTNKVKEILGVTGGNNIAKHASVKYDLYLKDETGKKVINKTGLPVDIGGYISIVAGPELIFSDDIIGLYAANGSAAYAGLISSLNAEVSTTNKKLVNVIGLRYQLSGSQLNDLTGAGYVTFRTSYDGSIVVTDGVTAAGPMSDFTRLTTKRITNATIAMVRAVCEPFIGLPNNLPQRNAITTAIQAGIDKMKEAGAIQDAKFELYSSLVDQRFGNALIDLTIIPAFEFRKIRVFVNLSNPV